MKSLVKNTIIYTIGNVLPQAIGFILLPIYTKYMSTEEFGIVSSMQVIQFMLAFMFPLCLDRSIQRLYWDYESDSEKKVFLGTLSISIFAISIIILLILFILNSQVEKIFSSISFYPFYFYAIMSSFFQVIGLVPLNILMLKHKARQYFVLSSVQTIINISFVIWFVVYNQNGAEGMLLARMLSFGIILPIYLYIIFSNIVVKIDKNILSKAINFSIPIIPGLLAGWVINQVDRIFIEKYFTLSDVGIYSLSRQIASSMTIFSTAFAMAYRPIFFELANKNEQDIIKPRLASYNNIYILASIFICFIISFFAKEVIIIFLNEKYWDAYKFIPLITFSYTVIGISGTIVGGFFQQSKMIKQDTIIAIILAAITIFLCYILIIPFGAYGAMYVSLISSLVLFAIGYLYAKKYCFFIKFHWKLIIPILFILFTVFVLMQELFLNINIYFLLLFKLLIAGIIFIIFYQKYSLKIKAVLTGSY